MPPEYLAKCILYLWLWTVDIKRVYLLQDEAYHHTKFTESFTHSQHTAEMVVSSLLCLKMQSKAVVSP